MLLPTTMFLPTAPQPMPMQTMAAMQRKTEIMGKTRMITNPFYCLLSTIMGKDLTAAVSIQNQEP